MELSESDYWVVKELVKERLNRRYKRQRRRLFILDILRFLRLRHK